MGFNKTARQHIINIAVEQANEYAHYLWGSQGSTPNAGREVKFNRKNVTPATVSFCAAYCDRDSGPQVCGGLYARKTLAPGMTNPTAASSPELKKWIDRHGHESEIDWDNTLTPRLIKGVGVPVQIVWGEGCDGTRHFDCISFINWCLGKGRMGKFSFDMYQYFYSIEPKNGVIPAVDVTDENEADAMPADLLLYGDVVAPATYFQEQIDKEHAAGDTKGEVLDKADLEIIEGSSSQPFTARHHIPCVPKYGVGAGIHHIGFAIGNGKKGRVHAMDTAHGVVVDTWGNPVRRIRLPDSFFV